jgi:hypothetical protein
MLKHPSTEPFNLPRPGLNANTNLVELLELN